MTKQRNDMQRLQRSSQFAQTLARGGGEGGDTLHGGTAVVCVGGVVLGGEALLVVGEAAEGEPPGRGRGGGRAVRGRRRVDEGVQGRPDYREVGAGRGAGVDPDCWFLRMLDG